MSQTESDRISSEFLREIKSLTKINPHIDCCAHCQKVEILHWQLETFKGEWGHICQDCYAIFSETVKGAEVPICDDCVQDYQKRRETL